MTGVQTCALPISRSWSSLQRQRFANDLGFRWSLNAITSSVNSAKGDADPAQWLPPEVGVRCAYAIRWMEVKYRWRLSIDATERSALQRLLSGTCGQRVITLPPLAPKDTGTTGSSTSGNCDPAYPGVCIPPPPPGSPLAEWQWESMASIPSRKRFRIPRRSATGPISRSSSLPATASGFS